MHLDPEHIEYAPRAPTSPDPIDPYAVGQFLGHKTPRMTQRHAHLSPGYMAEAAGKLDVMMGQVLPDRTNSGHALVPAEFPRNRSSVAKTSKLLD